jgi:hypothetical protein
VDGETYETSTSPRCLSLTGEWSLRRPRAGNRQRELRRVHVGVCRLSNSLLVESKRSVLPSDYFCVYYLICFVKFQVSICSLKAASAVQTSRSSLGYYGWYIVIINIWTLGTT